MKHTLTTIFSIDLLFNFCFADEKLELRDLKNKKSYSLGYQLGQSLKFQGMDINLNTVGKNLNK